jgi:hypothetical protein
MNKKISILALLVILISSCGKNETSPDDYPQVTKLQIREKGSHIPVPGADVYLMQHGTSANNSFAITHLVSDEQGYVKWLPDARVAGVYASAEGYFNTVTDEVSIYQSPVLEGYYDMIAPAGYRFSVVDDAPTETGEYFKHSINISGHESFYNVTSSYPLYYDCLANVPYTVRVLKFNNASGDTLSDETYNVQVNSFDTLDFVIHY